MDNPVSSSPLVPIPPPFPQDLPGQPSKRRAFTISSLVAAGVGVLPLLAYLVICAQPRYPSFYSAPPSILPVLLMGFAGFFVHGLALIAGIVAIAMESKPLGFLAVVLNGGILFVILIAGLMVVA